MNSGGEIVKKNGQEYQAVQLTVNGVIKRVLVPLGNAASDDFIPTPDHPAKPKPSGTTTAVTNIQPQIGNIVNNVIATTNAIANTPTTIAPPSTLSAVQVAKNASGQNVVQLPLTLNIGPNGQLMQAVNVMPQNQQTVRPPTIIQGTPVTVQSGIPQVTPGTNIVRLPASSINTNVQPNQIIQGTIVQQNKNPGGAPSVQFGTIIQPGQTPNVQQATVVGSPTATNFPSGGVYQIDSTGRIVPVKGMTPVTSAGTQQTAIPLFGSATPQGSTVISANSIGQPRVIQPSSTPNIVQGTLQPGVRPGQPQQLTLRTQDGRVFTIPGSILPMQGATATSATTLTNVAVSTAANTQNKQTVSAPAPTVISPTTVATVPQAPSTTTSVQAPRPVVLNTGSAGGTMTTTRAVTLPTSAMSLPTTSSSSPAPSNNSQFISIAPKRNVPAIPMGVATIMPARDQQNKSDSQQNKSDSQQNKSDSQNKPDTPNEDTPHVDASKDKDTVVKETAETTVIAKPRLDPVFYPVEPEANKQQESKGHYHDAFERFVDPTGSKKRKKNKDKEYVPTQNVKKRKLDDSGGRRRRSSRIKTKPCHVVLKKLKISRRAIINVNDMGLLL